MDEETLKLLGRLEGDVETLQGNCKTVFDDIAALQIATGQCVEDRKGIRRDLDIVAKDRKEMCGQCPTQKIVYAVVGVMGLGVVAAILALVVKGVGK